MDSVYMAAATAGAALTVNLSSRVMKTDYGIFTKEDAIRAAIALSGAAMGTGVTCFVQSISESSIVVPVSYIVDCLIENSSPLLHVASAVMAIETVRAILAPNNTPSLFDLVPKLPIKISFATT